MPLYSSISVVYNLRVTETSKHLDVSHNDSKPWWSTATFFSTFREKYNGIKHRCQAGMISLLYVQQFYFLRVDTAVGNVASHDHGTYFSQTQTDDLLLSAGYSPTLSPTIRFSFSGLLGIPTHKDKGLEHVQCGYAHYGIGAQLDGSLQYSNNPDHLIRCAARCIHFFSRDIKVHTSAPFSFSYQLGNLADLFISWYGKRGPHSIESGYDASFFFGAHTHPTLLNADKRTNYIRNSFYGIYKYHVEHEDVAHVFALAASYGYEPVPKIVGNKNLFTFWTFWSLNF